MTAEIAILNKGAVALATDSAVTLSGGGSEKVFDSADKLFELSCKDPIAVMVYNGMSFLGVPIYVLIKEFRDNADHFNTVQEAADAFLAFLQKEGNDAPRGEVTSVINGTIAPVLYEIEGNLKDRFFEAKRSVEEPQEINLPDILDEILTEWDKRISDHSASKALKFEITLSKNDKKNISDTIDKIFPHLKKATKTRMMAVVSPLITGSYMSGSRTGLVFAGFGVKEKFPTLVAYEIDGWFNNSLKCVQTEKCDIDREGPTAHVVPFAQKEMVHRFLYGVDDQIERTLSSFCEAGLKNFADQILGAVEFSEESDTERLKALSIEAMSNFLTDLSEDVFAGIVRDSQAEIANMVEFMPKPDLAKMAESLIDLTSIKRKVSNGLETVGGPVDVAVLSKSEGFVWVKRKHYFPAELNSRFFSRMSQSKN